MADSDSKKNVDADNQHAAESIRKRIEGIYQKMVGGFRYKTPEEMSTNRAAAGLTPVNQYSTNVGVQSFTDHIYKAVIPQFFYKPPYGLPLFKDIPEMRRLGATPYVAMIRNTIANEMGGLDWDIKVEEGTEVPDEIIGKTKDFFYNPNRNEESISYIIKQLVGDSCEVDAAVLEKIYNLKGELVEIYARDGALYTKNPDIHGVLPIEYAYWQYSWTVGQLPIPFNRDEIVYMTRNARTDQVYGRSEVENLLDMLQLLLYGVDSNLEYFSDNMIPKGVFTMIGANGSDIKAFKEQFQEEMRKRDVAGKWRKYFHKMPVMNTDGQFIRVGFNNIELEMIEQQKWFTKLVWSCFNITPSELGFTEDSNRSTEIMQSSVVKRKLLKPYMNLIEYHFDTEVVNILPWIQGTIWENKIHFEFDKTDLGMEKAELDIVLAKVRGGLMTPNEARERLHMDPIDGADQLQGMMGMGMGGSQGSFGKQDTASIMGNEEQDIDKKPEEKALKKKVYRAAEYEVKALGTDSPTNLVHFETPGKNSKAKDKFMDIYASQLSQILGSLNFEAEQKGLVSDLLQKVSAIVGLGGLEELVRSLVTSAYQTGLDSSEQRLDQNFLPDPSTIDFIKRYTFENVSDLVEETRNDLRQQLQQGMLASETREQLTERVKKVLDVSQNRAKAIVATETNRAENAGKLQGFKASGKEGLAQWKMVEGGSHSSSDACVRLNGKTAIPGDLFIDTQSGFQGQGPPAHPNCACQLVFKEGF